MALGSYPDPRIYRSSAIPYLHPNMNIRQIPRISLRDFDTRRYQIGKELIEAAENVGFFILVDQQRPSKQEIEEMFALSYVHP